jgi:hypothetical protein
MNHGQAILATAHKLFPSKEILGPTDPETVTGSYIVASLNQMT